MPALASKMTNVPIIFCRYSCWSFLIESARALAKRSCICGAAIKLPTREPISCLVISFCALEFASSREYLCSASSFSISSLWVSFKLSKSTSCCFISFSISCSFASLSVRISEADLLWATKITGEQRLGRIDPFAVYLDLGLKLGIKELLHGTSRHDTLNALAHYVFATVNDLDYIPHEHHPLAVLRMAHGVWVWLRQGACARRRSIFKP